MRAGTRLAAAVLTMLMLVGCATNGPENGDESSAGGSNASTLGATDGEGQNGEAASEGAGQLEEGVQALHAGPVTPVRAVWVHLFDGSLKSKESIAQLVDELIEAEATMVIAQVVRRHDAYYASSVLPRTEDPDVEPGLDVLEELIPRAHAAGIEVHAWVGMAPTWHEAYRDLPAPEGWLTAEHGRDAPEDERWVTRNADGEWSDYLDPAVPQVRTHLAAIATELALTTEVDGIHLDYVRYASEQHGYHPAAIARYQQEVGRESTPAPDDKDFMAWRRDQTRGVIEHVSDALAATGRDVTLSAAVVTWGPGPAGTEAGSFDATRPAVETFQDWPEWARDGLVDMLFPMNYFREHVAEQAVWFDQWLDLEAELATTTDTLIVPGIGGWLNAPDAALEQIGAATAATDGAAMYSYQQPTDDEDDQVRAIWRDLAQSAWSAR